MIFRTRDLLVWQRTQLINALCGYLTEFGWCQPEGATVLDGRPSTLVRDRK